MFSRRIRFAAVTFGLILTMVLAADAGIAVLCEPEIDSANAQSTSNLTVQPYNITVPTQYLGQYNNVTLLLNQFNASLGAAPSSPNSFTYSAELLPANGNQGLVLFNSSNLVGVSRNLNALKAMGVKGVTIAVGYPLLDPTFPNSTQYLNYFQTVVNMSHQLGFVVDIESQVLFANTPYSPLTYNWSTLPYADFVVRHIDQDNLICSQIRPDILEIGVESDTEAALTGYTQLGTAAGWSNYINQLLNGVNKNGCKLAAGAGDWLLNTTRWIQGFVNNTNLDFISTHSYPSFHHFSAIS